SPESPKPQPTPGDQKKDGQQKPAAQPTPTPGEKKEGDVKSNAGGGKNEEKQPAKPAPAAEEKEKEGEMSVAQARALLKALNSEEEKVNLMQQPYTEETLRDW
ncbi:MAG: hypothetical protein WCS31_17255, partial [Verrucomicrobiae bacterium]